MPSDSEVSKEWKAQESAQADVRLIMTAKDAKRPRKPQPHLQAAQAPLRKTILLMANNDMSTGWEDWQFIVETIAECTAEVLYHHFWYACR